MKRNHEILKKIDSGRRSNWVKERAKKRGHKKAQEYARLVAIHVLTILRERKMSQTELAEKMGVSRQQVTKILKGQENFTFETIAKLEAALDVTLMTITFPEPNASYGQVHLKGSISLSYTQPLEIQAVIFVDRVRQLLQETEGTIHHMERQANTWIIYTDLPTYQDRIVYNRSLISGASNILKLQDSVNEIFDQALVHMS